MNDTESHAVSAPDPAAPGDPKISNDRQELKREVIDFVKLVVWFLVIFLALRTYVIEGYEVQGPSMEPTLQNNERILVLKLPHILSQWGLFASWKAIDSGDIVVFDSPDTANKRYVKRVVARGAPGRVSNTAVAESEGGESKDGVKVVFDLGKVYVDGILVEEDYLRDEAKVSNDRRELLLEPGEYYVLGDNRRVSKDSRSFKAIDDDMIIGRAFLRFWPPRKIALLR